MTDNAVPSFYSHDIIASEVRRHLTEGHYRLAQTRALRLTRALHSDLTHARGYVQDHDLAVAFDRALDRAKALSRAIASNRPSARDHQHTLDRVLYLESGLDHAVDLAIQLENASHHVTETLHDTRIGCKSIFELLVSASAQEKGAAGLITRAAVGPVGSAVGTIRRALHLLPAAERARYEHEYLAELHTLAAEGSPGRVQLVYAVRVTYSMWSLRRALRAPRPGRERAR